MDINEVAIRKHKEWNGKLNTVAKSSVSTKEDLSIAYTPGVAAPCVEIKDDPSKAYTYTMKAYWYFNQDIKSVRRRIDRMCIVFLFQFQTQIPVVRLLKLFM